MMAQIMTNKWGASFFEKMRTEDLKLERLELCSSCFTVAMFCWCKTSPSTGLKKHVRHRVSILYNYINELYLTGESSDFTGQIISCKLASRVLPLSVKLPKLKKARVSWPTTAAISCINIRSKVAAHDGPDGNEVEQRESGPSVQLEDMEEWMQLEPQ